MTSLLLFAALVACIGSVHAEDCPLAKAKQHVSAKTKPNTTSIVKTAASAGSFRTLLTLLIAADLDDALKGDGPFTVFAPTDDAFAKLPKGTVEKLLKEENRKQLVDVLKYHVVASKVLAKDLVKAEKSKTLQGGSVVVAIIEGRVVINESKVLTSDVPADNGVIHIIDRVLLPSRQ